MHVTDSNEAVGQARTVRRLNALACVALVASACGARQHAGTAASKDAPQERLAAAERAAAAAPRDSLAQARAGMLRYLVASDPAGALELYARARAAAQGRAQDEGAAFALAGTGEILEDRLDPEGAARAFAEALRATPPGAALPVAEWSARRLLELQGESRAVDDVLLASADAADEAARRGAGLPGAAAMLLRTAAARVEGERAADVAGLSREAARWRAAGAVQQFRMAGPYAALRLGQLGKPLALDGPSPVAAPDKGPAGSTAERTLSFPDGDAGLDLEPAEGDVYYAASDVSLARGGDYLVAVEGAAALELRIDGAVQIARTPWPREVPREEVAAATLAAGKHALLVRFSRAEGQRFRVTLARADGAPSDAQSEAPAQLTGARASAPCALGASCVRAPAFADGGGLRGYAERTLARDDGDAIAAFFLVRATLGDDKPAARLAVERLMATTGKGAPALMQQQALEQHDAEVPERIGRSRGLADLAEAVRKDPLLVRARVAAAALQRESERYDDAAAELDRAEQALRALAGPAATAGNSATDTTPGAHEADSAHASRVRAPPKDAAEAQAALPARLLLSRARLVDAQGNAAKALSLVRAAIAREDRCDARLLGLDLLRREGGLDAQLALAETLRGCEAGRAALAGLLRDRGQLPRAEALYALAAAARPAHPGRREQLADLLVAEKKFDEAARALRAASALTPRSPEPLRRLAGILDLSGDAKAADEVRAEALLRAPGDLLLRRQLAQARGDALLDWSARDGREIARRPSPPLAPGEAPPSAVMLLDQGAVQVFSDGGAVERVHSVVRVLNKRGIGRHGEVQVPGDAEVLELRTLKADGRVLEPESIPEKEGVSMPGLEPGDAVELDYLRGIAPRGPDLPGFSLGAFFFRDDETPLAETSYEARAPEGVTLEVDAHNLAGPSAVTHEHGEVRFVHSARDVKSAQPEPSAPAETETLPWVQVGAGSGDEPLYASIADWALLRARPSAATDALARSAGGATPREKAERIYAAVAQAVRGRSTGNDFSAPAAHVLAQGRGNRLLLLKAAFASAGLGAHLALVRPFSADPASYRFPRGDLFTYAVLRLDLPEGAVWIDPALRLAPFGHLPSWARGQLAWILPEPGERPEQVRTPDEPARVDGRSIAFDLTLAPDGTAAGTGRDAHRGFDAASLKDTLERIDQVQRKQAVESMLGRALRGVSLDKLSAEGEGAVGGEAALDYALHGELARQDGDELRLPASTFPSRLRRHWVQKAERALPLLIDQPEESEAQTTIALPPGTHLRAAPKPVSLDTPYGKYAWEAREEAGKLRVRESLSVPAQRVPPARYAQFVAFARAVDEAQEQELRVGR